MKEIICVSLALSLALLMAFPAFADSSTAASSDASSSLSLDSGDILDSANSALDEYGSGLDDAISSAQSGIPIDDSSNPDLHLFDFPHLIMGIASVTFPTWFLTYLIFFAAAITAYSIYKSLGGETK